MDTVGIVVIVVLLLWLAFYPSADEPSPRDDHQAIRGSVLQAMQTVDQVRFWADEEFEALGAEQHPSEQQGGL